MVDTAGSNGNFRALSPAGMSTPAGSFAMCPFSAGPGVTERLWNGPASTTGLPAITGACCVVICGKIYAGAAEP